MLAKKYFSHRLARVLSSSIIYILINSGTNNNSWSIIFKRQLSQSLYFSLDQSMIDAHGIGCLIKFQVKV